MSNQIFCDGQPCRFREESPIRFLVTKVTVHKAHEKGFTQNNLLAHLNSEIKSDPQLIMEEK